MIALLVGAALSPSKTGVNALVMAALFFTVTVADARKGRPYVTQRAGRKIRRVVMRVTLIVSGALESPPASA